MSEFTLRNGDDEIGRVELSVHCDDEIEALLSMLEDAVSARLAEAA